MPAIALWSVAAACTDLASCHLQPLYFFRPAESGIQNFSFLMQPRNPGIVSHLCCLWPCISPYATKAAAAAALSPRAMSTPLAAPACTPLRLGILLYRLKMASLRLEVLYVKLYTLEQCLAMTPSKIAPGPIRVGTRVEFYRQ